MKDVFLIFESYEVDGGFGDAIPQTSYMGYIRGTEQDAKTFCERWSRTSVYDVPYAELHEGTLIYKPLGLELLPDESPFPKTYEELYPDDSEYDGYPEYDYYSEEEEDPYYQEYLAECEEREEREREDNELEEASRMESLNPILVEVDKQRKETLISRIGKRINPKFDCPELFNKILKRIKYGDDLV